MTISLSKTTTIAAIRPEKEKSILEHEESWGEDKQKKFIAEKLKGLVKLHIPDAELLQIRFPKSGPIGIHYLTPYRHPKHNGHNDDTIKETPNNIKEWIARQKEENEKLVDELRRLGMTNNFSMVDPAAYYDGAGEYKIPGYCQNYLCVDVKVNRLANAFGMSSGSSFTVGR